MLHSSSSSLCQRASAWEKYLTLVQCEVIPCQCHMPPLCFGVGWFGFGAWVGSGRGRSARVMRGR